MPHARFGLRALLCVMFVSAIAMFGWLQYRAYQRTHVFIEVVDQESGNKLDQYEYQFLIVTADTIPDPFVLSDQEDFSAWAMHEGVGLLTLTVPENCRLEIHVRSLELAGGYDWTSHEELVLPELPHAITIRVKQGESLKGIVFDAETHEPLKDVNVSSGDFNDDFSVKTDAEGRFHLRNIQRGGYLRAAHRQYQVGELAINQLDINETVSIGLTKARRITGQVRSAATGQPISGCEISQPRRMKTDGFIVCGVFGGGVLNFPERSDTTDELGRFDFYFDDTSESSLVINKKGWSGKRVDVKTDSASLDPVLLDPVLMDQGSCILRGRVVNQRGKPVTQFKLQAEVNDGRFYRGKETTQFDGSDGKFEVNSLFSLDAFTVQSESDGVFFHSRFRSKEEDKVDLLNLEIVLQDALTLTGQLTGSVEAKKHSEVYLLRGYVDRRDEWQQPNHDGISCLRAELTDSGAFRLERLASGEYTLVTLCNGYLVNKRPVTIHDRDANLSNIALPQLLNVAGTIESSDGTMAKIGLFDLERDGQIVPFRTNHRGEFSFTNLPAGRYSIKERGGDYLDRLDQPVVSVNFQESRGYRVSLQESPLLELDLDSVGQVRELNVELKKMGDTVVGHSVRQSAKDPCVFVGTQVVGDFETNVVFSSCGLGYELSIKTHLDSHTLPSQYRLRTREISFGSDELFASTSSDPKVRRPWGSRECAEQGNDPFSDQCDTVAKLRTVLDRRQELSVNRVTDDSVAELMLLRDRELLGRVSMDELIPSITVVVADRDPDTCMLRSPRHGWAKIAMPKLVDEQFKAPDVRLTPGVNLSVRCFLDCLPLFPKSLRLFHSEGAEMRREFDNYSSEAKFDFCQIWPGRWSVEIVGDDPARGETVLDQREFLVGVKDVVVELGKEE